MARTKLIFATAASLFTMLSLQSATFADTAKLPEEISKQEGPRDCNLFQVEPTVLNERWYTSGACERHQNVGTTLPEGSPIPDTEGPSEVHLVVPAVQPHVTPPQGLQPGASTPAKILLPSQAQ